VSGLGDILSQAASLGLAGAKGLGQVAAKGLGLAPPPETTMFGAPAQSQPADLSDLSFQQNPLGNVLMRVQNAIASSQGQPSASGQLRAQRAAGNQQRVQAFQEGMNLLQQFDAIRQKAAPGDFDRVDGLLKKRFAEVAGGKPGEADDFYDAFMSGGAGQTAGLLKLVAGDAGAQQLIASGGTVADLHKYVADKSHEGIILGDQEALPGVRQKLEAITAGAGFTPEQSAKLDALKSTGGRWTLGSLQDFNDQLPPELQMNAGEWAIAKRHEGDLTSINGIETTPEVLQHRKAEMDSSFKQLADAQKHQYDLELQNLKNQGMKDRPVGGSANLLTRKDLWASKTLDKQTAYRDTESKLRQDLAVPYNGPGSYQVLTGWIHNLDNTAARSEEVDTVRNEAASLANQLRGKLASYRQGAVIPEQTFNEIKSLVQSNLGRTSAMHRRYLGDRIKIGKYLFGEDAVDQMVPGWRQDLGESQGKGNAPATPSGAAPAAGGQVHMRFPDGAEKMVPAADVSKWTALGGTPVQ